MDKKVSLSISNSIYKELTSLSDFYKQDVKDTIGSILDAVSKNSRGIINLSKEYKVPIELNTVMFDLLEAAFNSTSYLFNELLEKLEVKGLFRLEDSEIKLDEEYMWFYYSALGGCNLYVDTFDITIERGLRTLTTYSHIEVNEVNKQILEKLKKLVQSIEEPYEFADSLEDFNIEIEETEQIWTLQIDLVAESLAYLPSVNRVSEFVKQMFKKAGMKIA